MNEQILKNMKVGMKKQKRFLVTVLLGIALALLPKTIVVAQEALTGPILQLTPQTALLTINDGWMQANPSGFGTANNQAVNRLVAFSGYLYAGTTNNVSGGQVWRTSNGTTWAQANTAGFGSASNLSARVAADFNGRLYTGTENPTNGAEIWRCAVCDGSDWTRVVSGGFGNVKNHTLGHLIVFSNTLYATVNNAIDGAQVWKSTTGEAGSWTQSSTTGFGDARNTELWGVDVFNGYLYVSTAQWDAYDAGTNSGIEVWRTQNGANWQQVNADGFGDRYNLDGVIVSYNGYLYGGTYNPPNRAQVWRCANCNGTDWTRVISAGFGDGNNDGIEFMLPFGEGLYATTHNSATGTEVWQTADGLDWSQVNRDGFGVYQNASIYGGAAFNNRLFLGSKDQTHGGQVWMMLPKLYLPLILR